MTYRRNLIDVITYLFPHPEIAMLVNKPPITVDDLFKHIVAKWRHIVTYI